MVKVCELDPASLRPDGRSFKPNGPVGLTHRHPARPLPGSCGHFTPSQRQVIDMRGRPSERHVLSGDSFLVRRPRIRYLAGTRARRSEANPVHGPSTLAVDRTVRRTLETRCSTRSSASTQRLWP